MAEILNDFPVKATAANVFQAVSTPQGLDAWWTLRSSGQAATGNEYELWFGPKHDWRAVVAHCVADREFELQLTDADPDWVGTHVGFVLAENAGVTEVRFYHRGWPEANEHYRISCYCWPMYLRLLRRYLEHGEIVPYADRLDV